MTITADDIARRAANRLAESVDPALPATVERHLHAGHDSEQPTRYVDPATAIALGGLVVSIASLAWTIYRDLKSDTETPSSDVLDRRIRVAVEVPEGVTPTQRDRIIEVIVEEMLRPADAAP